MDFINQLIQLANQLDRIGLYKEADEVDEIIKEAADQSVNVLRKELGLGPGIIDNIFIQKLNKMYPGVWAASKTKKPDELLSLIQKQKVIKNVYTDSRKKMFDINKAPVRM